MRRACSRHVPVRLRLLEALSSALGIALLLPYEPAFGACDNTAPVSGQTVTCSSSAPSPSTTPVAAVAGSTNVTVNVQAGAELDVTGNNVILVRDGSTVTNLGTLRGAGDTFDAISAHGASGGAGHDVLINRGTIVTSGVESEGMFNSAAAVTMLNDTAGVIRTTGDDSVAMHDFASPGGGTLTNNGTLSTSGSGSHGMAALTNNDTVVNNGAITTIGAGSHGMVANGNAVGGTGNNVLTNHGTIDVWGAGSDGLVSSDTAPGVVTNTGSITAHGAGGLGAIFPGPVALNNAARASIVSQQANCSGQRRRHIQQRGHDCRRDQLDRPYRRCGDHHQQRLDHRSRQPGDQCDRHVRYRHQQHRHHRGRQWPRDLDRQRQRHLQLERRHRHRLRTARRRQRHR
jgi:hypothetical protein